MSLKNIREIKTKSLRWVDVTDPTKREVKYIQENFDFHQLDVAACLPPNQRPKVFTHPDYIFMILQFPTYDRKTREIRASEIDFFITPDLLITTHSSNLTSIKELFNKCKDNKNFRNRKMNGNPAILLYEILNELFMYCFPMLNHISLDIDDVDDGLFSENAKVTVEDILIIKRNIINFRKAMQFHKTVIKKLIEKAPQFFSVAKLNIYFHTLIAHTKEIWDNLENYKDSINAIHETNESLISFKTNEIIKTLTIFSVIVFPLTLLAAIFGMNTLNGMPLIDHPHGFEIVMTLMLVLTLIMAMFFKKKKWL